MRVTDEQLREMADDIWPADEETAWERAHAMAVELLERRATERPAASDSDASATSRHDGPKSSHPSR